MTTMWCASFEWFIVNACANVDRGDLCGRL
jgi:hypothetical protein